MKRLVPFQLILLSVAASALASSIHADRAYTESSDQIDTIPDLTSKTQQQGAIFSEAVQLLDSLKTSPSCNHIAATKLVTSCQTLEGKDSADADNHERLDRIRSIYAARLAICELEGAGAQIPSPCLPVAVSSSAPKTLFGFATKFKVPTTGSDIVPLELLEQCLRALESRPQWWTSYSNSRQNAMVICQASRMEVEQEELLNLHRSILKSSIRLDEGLQEAIRKAAMETAQHQAFVQTVQELQEGLARDIKRTQSVLEKTFGRFLHEVETGIDTVVIAFNSALSHVQKGVVSLRKEIRNASSQVNSLQQALQTAHQDAMSHSLQALHAQEQNNIIYMKSASDLQLSLESLTESDMAKLTDRVRRFDALLEWLSSRLILILEQESNTSQRLQYLQTTIRESQEKAEELQQVQQSQAETLAAQAQAQKTLQANARVSQALLDKATTTAANLHAIIDEAAMRYKQAPGFHLGGTPSWVLCIIALLIIGAPNSKFAVSICFLIFGHLIATSFLQFF